MVTRRLVKRQSDSQDVDIVVLAADIPDSGFGPSPKGRPKLTGMVLIVAAGFAMAAESQLSSSQISDEIDRLRDRLQT